MRAWFLVSIFALGCSKSSSDAVKDDIEKLCNAEALSGADELPRNSPARTERMLGWVAENVNAPPVRKFLQELASNGEGSRRFKEFAAEHGYTGPCPMADAN